jgi:hypothetical protein
MRPSRGYYESKKGKNTKSWKNAQSKEVQTSKSTKKITQETFNGQDAYW